MPAYLLLLAALLSRVIPHSGWFGFTAVGGSLLYFGARRSWKEMLLPIAALAAVDYYLTTHVYAYQFHVSEYVVTWGWYAAAIVLGRILLAQKTTFPRVIAASILGPTSFFLVSNYAAWLGMHNPGGLYANSLGGLMTCLAAGLPFYERDIISTAIVVALAFGLPVAIRNFQHSKAVPVSTRISR